MSLSIAAGSWVAVTGASGSGKSTLLHTLGAMERADAGSISAGGTEVTALRGRGLAAYRRRVGQQRLAIAPGAAERPGVAAADEPTGNLDSANAAGILRLVGELRARRPVTVIIATHDPQVAGSAERIIRLRDGAVTGDTGLTAAKEMVCPGQGG